MSGATPTYPGGTFTRGGGVPQAPATPAQVAHARAVTVVPPGPLDHLGSAVAAPFQAVGSVGDFLGKITDPHFSLRVVYVVGGVAAILLGLRMLAGESGPAGAVGSVVKSGTDHVAAAAKNARQAATVAAMA